MATGVGLTTEEAAQLRALIHAAWPHRHGPRAPEFAQAIVDWHYLRPIARGDLREVKRLAHAALAFELGRYTPPLPVDDLVRLCERLPCERRLRSVA